MPASLDRLVLDNVPYAFFVERGLVFRAVLNAAPHTSRVAFASMVESLVETKDLEVKPCGEYWQDNLRRLERKGGKPPDVNAADFELVADHATILAVIHAFCEKTGIAESEFGRRVVGDGSLVARLREGKDITTKTLRAIERALTQ